MTRIELTMKRRRGGGLFPLVIELPDEAIELLGFRNVLTAARMASWVMFGGLAESQHEYICTPPADNECRHGLPLDGICPRCCEEGL